MSATLPSREGAHEPTDISTLHARRRAARRRRSLARLDLTIGVLVAIALLIASPGWAITAVIALGALGICLVWTVVGRLLR